MTAKTYSCPKCDGRCLIPLLDGDVSLDVFPGFTYDARKDGYTKTSLFWRLFRYERDPNAGTSVDFLFLPVWR